MSTNVLSYFDSLEKGGLIQIPDREIVLEFLGIDVHWNETPS
jgi:hypothetical protein